MITLASQLLEKTVSSNASDVFIVAGLPVSMRLNGIIVHEDEERLKPNDTAEIIKQIYQMANERDMQTLLATGDDDFSFSIPGLSRFRVSAYQTERYTLCRHPGDHVLCCRMHQDAGNPACRSSISPTWRQRSGDADHRSCRKR